jgi:hypothetical protein
MCECIVCKFFIFSSKKYFAKIIKIFFRLKNNRIFFILKFGVILRNFQPK